MITVSDYGATVDYLKTRARQLLIRSVILGVLVVGHLITGIFVLRTSSVNISASTSLRSIRHEVSLSFTFHFSIPLSWNLMFFVPECVRAGPQGMLIISCAVIPPSPKVMS